MNNSACNSERGFNWRVNSQIDNNEKMYDYDNDARNDDEPLSDNDDYYLEQLDDEQSGEESKQEEYEEEQEESIKKSWLYEKNSKLRKCEYTNNYQSEEVSLKSNMVDLESQEGNVSHKEELCKYNNQINSQYVFENVADLQQVIKFMSAYLNLDRHEVSSMPFTSFREKCTEIFNVEHPFVVSMDVLLVRMSYLAHEVSKIALLSEPASLLLLQKYNWQPTEVLSAYFLDSSRVLHGVNLTEENAKHAVRFHPIQWFSSLPSRSKMANNKNNLNKNIESCTTDSIDNVDVNAHDGDNIICEVCGTLIDTNVKMYFLEACRHTCCLNCWCAYLEYELNNNALCLDIRCPYNNCNELISIDGYYYLLTQQYKEKQKNNCEEYQEEMQKQRDLIKHNCCKCLICSSSRVRWCPNPQTCKGIVFLPEKFSVTQVVRCNLCNYEFCFQCGREKHAPATCEMIGDWENILIKTVQSECWIVNNCQRCPNCNKTFYKISGCDHMTCECKAEFCWRCGHLFKANEDYKCACSQGHIYDKTNQKESEEDMWRRTELQNSYVKKYKAWKLISSKLLNKINEIKSMCLKRSALVCTEFINAAEDKLECLQHLHEELRLAYSAMLHQKIFEYYTANTITATRQKCLCDKLEETVNIICQALAQPNFANGDDVSEVKSWIESLNSKLKAMNDLQM